MYAKQRLKSARASAQSDQSRRCPQEETLHPKMRPVKILIRLRLCPNRIRFLTLRFIFLLDKSGKIKNQSTESADDRPLELIIEIYVEI